MSLLMLIDFLIVILGFYFMFMNKPEILLKNQIVSYLFTIVN